MATSPNPVILIPARLASSRLPGKPLADIAGVPMVVRVLHRAQEAALGPVWVASADPEIAEAVVAAGGQAVMTRPDHPSGSDRIFEALQQIDPDGAFEAVVNLPSDQPFIEARLLGIALALLDDPGVDIATLAHAIADDAERDDPNVVKAVFSAAPGAGSGRALDFTRAAAPSGDGPLYHHFGVYAYRRAALERFIKLPPSPREQRERLEQLRALEAGMRIEVALVDTEAFDVNTPADLRRAREMLGAGA